MLSELVLKSMSEPFKTTETSKIKHSFHRNCICVTDSKTQLVIWRTGQVMLKSTVKTIENRVFAVVFFPFCGFVASYLKNGFVDGIGLLRTPNGHHYVCQFKNGFISESERLNDQKELSSDAQSDCVLKVLCDAGLSPGSENSENKDRIEQLKEIERQFEALMKSSDAIGMEMKDGQDAFFGLLSQGEHRPIGVKLTSDASLEVGEFRNNLRLKNGRKIGPLATVSNIKNYEVVTCIEHDTFTSTTQQNVSSLIKKDSKTVKKLGELKLDLESFACIELCTISEEVINEDIIKFNGVTDQALLREFISWKLTQVDTKLEGFVHGYLGKWLSACVADRPLENRAERKTQVKMMTEGRPQSNCRPSSNNSLFGSLMAANRKTVESPFKLPSKYSIINGNSEDFDDKINKRHGRKFINLPPKTEFIQTRKLARRAPVSPPKLLQKRTNFENRETVDNNHIPESQSIEEQSVRLEKLKRLFSPTNGSEPTKLTPAEQSVNQKTFSSKRHKGHSIDLHSEIASDALVIDGGVMSQQFPPDSQLTPKQQPQICLQVTPSKLKDLSIQCISIMTAQKSESKSVAVDTCPSEDNLNTSEQELTGYATDRSEKVCEFMTFHKVGHCFKKKSEGMC